MGRIFLPITILTIGILSFSVYLHDLILVIFFHSNANSSLFFIISNNQSFSLSEFYVPRGPSQLEVVSILPIDMWVSLLIYPSIRMPL